MVDVCTSCLLVHALALKLHAAVELKDGVYS